MIDHFYMQKCLFCVAFIIIVINFISLKQQIISACCGNVNTRLEKNEH